MSGDPFWQIIARDGLKVPAALAAFHRGEGRATWEGRCDIECGRGLIKGLLLRLGGFPRAGQGVSLRMETETQAGKSRWVRSFGGRKMVSTQRLVRKGIEERFGPIRLAMALSERDGGLDIRVVHLSVLRLPMPRSLLPQSVSREYQDAEGRFCFDISGDLPLLGRLIRYHGWLRPVPGSDARPPDARLSRT